MVGGPTIGVLTMSVGCDYFGSILGGIARTVAAADGRMITIQTLGAGTFDFDPPEPPEFGHPIAWDHVSAFIVILNSASRSYLEAIRAAGKPVIMISDEMPGFSCPVVLPDNRTGVREAVLHLVGHGHRDIAFAGYLELRDLRERYEAYRDALIECGITPRDDLYYDTGDNRESGGERAARAMMAAGMPSTAVLTGNDLNAIGLMRTLLDAGVDVPGDQAIAGFDDMDGVVYLTPSLSTVRQRFESLGHVAATLALRSLAGEEIEARSWYVPTSFQPRESCGCPDTLTLSPFPPGQRGALTPGPAAADGQSPDGAGKGLPGVPSPSAAPGTPQPSAAWGVPSSSAASGVPLSSAVWGVPSSSAAPGMPQPSAMPDVTSVEDLVSRLASVLMPARVEPASQAAVEHGADVINRALLAAASSAAGPNLFELRQALIGLNLLNRHNPEGVVQMMRYIRQFGMRLAQRTARTDEEAAERVRAVTEDIVVTLAQSRSRARPVEENEFLTTLKMLYTVSKNLLRSHEREPRALAWVQDTNARGGCLGLWAQPADIAVADCTERSEGREARPVGSAVADRIERSDGREARREISTALGDERALEVVSMFERERGLVPVPSGPISPRSFPPAEVVELGDLNADQMVYVAPLNIGTSDWGMLALVGPIEAHVVTGREMMNQWAALLAIALDHEAVLKSLREQEELLRHAALYDPLTGLANRTLFLSKLEQAIVGHARHPDRRYAVLLLDLDGFKLVNDSLGHLAGDRLLVRVAERIRASVRDGDLAARFGGDEFAILLNARPGEQDPVTVAERIRAALDVPFRLGEEEVTVSASIGISLSSNGYQHAEDVIRDADTAMYSAKWQRKGSHAVFDIAMHARVVGRLRTEADLRRALETAAFELHYQPIVRLDSGVICAFEALIRWQHPARGLVAPNDFLPIAEESGLMPPIGRWVLAEACRQVGAWRASGFAPDDLRISVNVSNRQFWHTRLLEDIEESLGAAGVDPSALIIEITEGVIVNDVPAARRKLAALHDMGVQLHIDDFGTGYSSLEALHRMPIDAFKIDRSFVAPLSTDDKSRELVRSIVSMGVNLGLELVAEGIETTEQRDHLRFYGCHHGQGYLFSGPVAGPEAEALLRDGPAAPDLRMALRALP